MRDSFNPLDRRRKKIARGMSLVVVASALFCTPLLDVWTGYWIVAVMLAVPTGLIGIGLLVESLIEYKKYMALLESGNRDSWDSRTAPTDYGPWHPGDD